MAKMSAARTAKTSNPAATGLPARARDASREAVTLETALRFAPTDDVSSKICKVFAMDPVPMAEIRETVEEHMVAQSRIMPLTDKNMEMHFQRVVGQYVGSAVSAARFYDTKRQAARAPQQRIGGRGREGGIHHCTGSAGRALRRPAFRGCFQNLIRVATP